MILTATTNIQFVINNSSLMLDILILQWDCNKEWQIWSHQQFTVLLSQHDLRLHLLYETKELLVFFLFNPIDTLTWPRIKIPYPLQWGAPTFNAGQSFGMVSAVLVSLIEVIPQVTQHNPWILSLEISNDKLALTMNVSLSLLDSPQPLTKLLLVLQVRLHHQLISWVEVLDGR